MPRDLTPDSVPAAEVGEKESDMTDEASVQAAQGDLLRLGAMIRDARLAARLTQGGLAGALDVTQACVSRWESGERDPGVTDLLRVADALGMPAASLLPLTPWAEPEPASAAPGDGQFMFIAFMGRIEYTGYVTEITKNGQPAYRIDLPEKIWGGNPLAYVEHAASAWFSDRPVTEESVRRAWESEVREAEKRRQQEAEWRRMDEQRALTTGSEDDDPDEDGPRAFQPTRFGGL